MSVTREVPIVSGACLLDRDRGILPAIEAQKSDANQDLSDLAKKNK